MGVFLGGMVACTIGLVVVGFGVESAKALTFTFLVGRTFRAAVGKTIGCVATRRVGRIIGCVAARVVGNGASTIFVCPLLLARCVPLLMLALPSLLERGAAMRQGCYADLCQTGPSIMLCITISTSMVSMLIVTSLCQ